MSEEGGQLGEGEGRAEQGLFMVTVNPQPVSLARAGRGDGQSRVAQGEAHGSCVPVGLGLDQSRELLSACRESPVFVPCRRKGSGASQAGSSLPEPGNFGKLGWLPAGLGCSDCRRL